MKLQQVVKAKLIVTPHGTAQLKATLEAYNRACNLAAELAFDKGISARYDLHHAAYYLLREQTALPAQHTVNAIAKLALSLRREPDKRHHFKPHSAMRFDARTLKLSDRLLTAGLTICPKGRVVGQLEMPASFRRKLRDWQFGSAELVYRAGQFYLHISVSRPAPETGTPSGSLGVDLGIKRLAVRSDGRFEAAKHIRHKKNCFQRTRRSLQAHGTKSAKRALARVSGREERFVTNENHSISKRIVAEAKAAGWRICLEDLTGIRARCAGTGDWSFAQLRFFIEYKAQAAGVEVVRVDPRYSSLGCSRCLHLGSRPDQSNFCCRHCGLRLNADLNAARHLAVRHDLIASRRYFCSIEPKEVNRRRVVRPLQRASSTKSGTTSP